MNGRHMYCSDLMGLLQGRKDKQPFMKKLVKQHGNNWRNKTPAQRMDYAEGKDQGKRETG